MSQLNSQNCNDWLKLALHHWSIGVDALAKENLKQALSLTPNPHLAMEETILNFAGIFPGWLDLLLDAKVPMDHILDGERWHSRQFLEKEDTALRFFQTYPALLDAFVEGDTAEVFDVYDENFDIISNWLPTNLKDVGTELLRQYGDASKQTLHFMAAYQTIHGLSWSDPDLEETLDTYMEYQNLEETDVEKIKALFLQKKLLEVTPQTTTVSSKPKL